LKTNKNMVRKVRKHFNDLSKQKKNYIFKDLQKLTLKEIQDKHNVTVVTVDKIVKERVKL
tara:strand:+ start:107 stop:286 length:180 start_codon:yes stop_codon:yes gene_type:complete